VQSGGVVTYTPNPGFAGVNTFTYRANDGQAVSNLATATVTVVNVANQAPLADDLFYQVAPGGTVTIVYSGSDPDGDPIKSDADLSAVSGVPNFFRCGDIPIPGLGWGAAECSGDRNDCCG